MPQSETYYLKLLPRLLTVSPKHQYDIHPLTRFKLTLHKNSQYYESIMDHWLLAGTHPQNIPIDTQPVDIIIDNTLKTNIFTINLLQKPYHKQSIIPLNEQHSVIGKHNLHLQTYIDKLKSHNLHHFKLKATLSEKFTLEFEVFIEQTIQALDKIYLEHQQITQHNLPKAQSNSSLLSDNFTDHDNEIQLQGHNRFEQHVTFKRSAQKRASWTKIDPQNLRSYSLRKNTSKIVRPKNVNLKMKISPAIMTDCKNLRNQVNQQQNEQQAPTPSPQLQSPQLIRLISQEVRPQPSSPFREPTKRPPLINSSHHKPQSKEQKRRKLLEQFQLKRIQFKKRIKENKQRGNQLPKPQSDRQLSRSNSFRSRKSMRSVKLSELEKMPEEKPWLKKEKEINQIRVKKTKYIVIVLLLFVLYFIMQPFKNVQKPTTPQIILTLKNKPKQTNTKKRKKKPTTKPTT